MLIEHYAELKLVHLTTVATSLSLFALRGLAVLLTRGKAAWTHMRAVRNLSVAIDSLLLASGLALWMALGLRPFAGDAWLAVKLGLLLAYIVLGSLALTRLRRPWPRATCGAAALVCATLIVAVAHTHQMPQQWSLWPSR